MSFMVDILYLYPFFHCLPFSASPALPSSVLSPGIELFLPDCTILNECQSLLQHSQIAGNPINFG